MKTAIEKHVERMALLKRIEGLIEMSEEMTEVQVAFINKLNLPIEKKCELEIEARNAAIERIVAINNLLGMVDLGE